MKKLRNLAILPLALLTMASCDFDVSGEENWEYAGDTLEACISITEDYFKDTFAHTNMTVRQTVNGNDYLTQVIDGDITHFVNQDGQDEYAFIDKDGRYIRANAKRQQYLVDERSYRLALEMYRNLLDFFPKVSETDSCSCLVKGHGAFAVLQSIHETEATFALTVENGSFNLNVSAHAKNDLIDTVDIKKVSGQSETMEAHCSFAYGASTVEIPDVTDWTLVPVNA